MKKILIFIFSVFSFYVSAQTAPFVGQRVYVIDGPTHYLIPGVIGQVNSPTNVNITPEFSGFELIYSIDQLTDFEEQKDDNVSYWMTYEQVHEIGIPVWRYPYYTVDTVSLSPWVHAGKFINSNYEESYIDYDVLTNKPVLFDGQYNSLTGIPSAFTPSSHSHAVIDVTGLQTALDSKLSSEVDASTTNEIELPSQTGQSGKILSTNGSAASWITAPSGAVTSSSNTPEGVGTGTVYTLTTTSAKIDFGTTDPSVTVPEAGTYLLFVNIKIEYSGLTTALQTAAFKLRRTNNTAADLTGATANVSIPAVTLLTGTGPDTDMRVIKYTTANSNDVIELWGNRQNGISITGSINVGEASITAVRIY